MKIIKRIYLIVLFASIPFLVKSQDGIRIVVVDENQTPMSGVLVIAERDIRGVTNDAGEVELKDVKAGDRISVKTSKGASKSIYVSDRETTVMIDKRSREVSLGFNIRKREEANTAAVGMVTSGDLSSSAINPANALYGTVSGLSVMQRTSVPWSNDPSLYVRGVGTLNNSSPLVLIDGFERALNLVSIDEIESVSVLKDAAALSLYGVRGANGVILVQTKRGLYEKMKVNVAFRTGVKTPFRLPKMADGYNYATAVNEAARLDGLPSVYSNQDLESFRTGSNRELFPSVDWAGESIKDQGYTRQLTASFTGGNDRIQYFSMIDYVGDDGFLKPVEMNPDYNSQMVWDRLNLRTNLDMRLTNTTNLRLNLLGQIAKQERPSVNFPELFPILYTVPSAAFPIKTNSNKWGGDYIHLNPVGELADKGIVTGNDRTLFADMRLMQDLSAWAKGLSAEVALAYDNRASYWDGRTKTYLSESLSPVRDASGNIIEINRGQYGQQSALNFNHELGLATMMMAFDGKVNYESEWAEKHQLNTSLIYRMEEFSQNGRNNTFRRQNILGTAQYGYSQKYFVDLALSYSGSSVMTKGNRFRFFPALSAAWVVSSEDFMKPAAAVQYLKLRASTGLTGSDRFSYELDRQYYTLGGSTYYFGANNRTVSGNVEGALPNTDLNYELSYKTNVGFDANLFNHLSISADFFHDKRSNILVSAGSVYSSVIGVGMPQINEGEVRNLGFETNLTWNQKAGDWNYMVFGNFSFNKNKVINMNEGYRPEEYLERKGHPVGQFFGLESIGYFNDQNDISNSPGQSFSVTQPGDIKYRDQNGDGVIDEYDEVALGYSTLLPEIYYGFGFGAGYKGLSFKANFQGVANYSVVKNMTSMYWPLMNNTTVSDHYLNNRWTPENPQARYPRLTTLDNKNNYRNNSTWLEDGSFLKLRNVELGYALPQKLAKKIKSSGVNVFVRGANLFSIDKIKELDPELMYASYPSFRSYFFGINLAY